MVSIIIPTYNIHENKIAEGKKLLKRLMRGNSYELIFVNDGNGKGSAIMTGWKQCNGEYIILLDGDLQIEPYDIDTMFKMMILYNSDAVIGSKRHPYSIVHYSPFRHIVSNTYNLIVKLLFNIQLRDTQCGMKLFRKQAFDTAMSRVLVKQYAFDIELIVSLKDNGFRIAEAPVFVRKQIGKGSANAHNILFTLKDTLAVWWRRKNGWYHA